MIHAPCRAPIGLRQLLAYWFGELDEAAQARVDEHLLGCGPCSDSLAELVALGDAVRAVFAQGAVRAFVTDAFVKRLVGHGMRVREYRVARNGSVNCTVAPDDDCVVAHLEAPLAGVKRVDAISYIAGTPAEVSRDIPFDAASGEVVTLPPIAWLRTMPSHRQRVRLVAVDESGERVIGEYTFNHSAST